jgi:hypothetical protein
MGLRPVETFFGPEPVRSQKSSGKARFSMLTEQILQEARKLCKVSEGLGQLAKQDAQLAEALTILSGAVRQSATLLEVLATFRPGPKQLQDGRSN